VIIHARLTPSGVPPFATILAAAANMTSGLAAMRERASTLSAPLDLWSSRGEFPRNAVRTLRHPEVLQPPTNHEGVLTFDLAVDGRE